MIRGSVMTHENPILISSIIACCQIVGTIENGPTHYFRRTNTASESGLRAFAVAAFTGLGMPPFGLQTDAHKLKAAFHISTSSGTKLWSYLLDLRTSIKAAIIP